MIGGYGGCGVATEKLLLREPGGNQSEYGFGYSEIGKGDAETRQG